jgi:hypothetical protein
MNAIFQRKSNVAGRSGQPVPPLLATIELNPAGNALYLQRDQHIKMRDAAGWAVRALSGILWITQDGDSRDIVLEAGQSFVLDRNGIALLTPLGKADICVEHDAGRHAVQRCITAANVMPVCSVAGVYAVG